MFYQDISPNFFHHIFSNEDFSPNTSDQRLFTKNLLPIFLHQYFPPIISHPEFPITNSQSKFLSKHFPLGISYQKNLTKNFPIKISHQKISHLAFPAKNFQPKNVPPQTSHQRFPTQNFSTSLFSSKSFHLILIFEFTHFILVQLMVMMRLMMLIMVLMQMLTLREVGT